MLLFGEKKIYLSHLPMFDGLNEDKTEYTAPHRYQVILELTFQRGTQNLANIYSDDRRKNPGVKVAQQVTASMQTADARTLKFNLKADKEIYFEEGELLMPPTFEDTKLEQTTN